MKSVSTFILPFGRRSLLGLAALSLAAFSGTAPTRAQRGESATAVRTVTAVGGTAAPNTQTFVSIELEAIGDEVAGSFTVTFDQTKLSISGVSSPSTNPDVTIGTGVPAGSALTVNGQQVALGRIGLLQDSTNLFAASPPNRQIVRLRFVVAGNAPAGPTTISFGNIPTPRSFSNGFGEPLAAIFQDGTVNITAAAPNVTVSGRVTGPTGIPIRGALVSMLDTNNVVRRIATTSTFGYYVISDVPSQLNYNIGVSSRRYRFTPVTMMITADVTNLDFVGQE